MSIPGGIGGLRANIGGMRANIGGMKTRISTQLRQRPRMAAAGEFVPRLYSRASMLRQRVPRPSGPAGPSGERPRGFGSKARPFRRRLRSALNATKVEWFNIPIGLGIAVVLALHAYHRTWKERETQEPASVRPTGPWQVRVLGALPLNTMSRIWGKFNEMEIPVWMREPGFKLYGWIFGCNFDEIREKDLKKFRNLAEFFYREIDPARRPIAAAPIVSPADGKVLHLGIVDGNSIEQVKGMTYSLDALLGSQSSEAGADAETIAFHDANMRHVTDKDFAEVNGISYSLDDLIGHVDGKNVGDATVVDGASDGNKEGMASMLRIARDAGIGALGIDGPRKLFFAVIYLAPGDYHRFHSPTSWVVETRRHFAGDLFSVSPYIAGKLANLFVLNERVALLGKYRWGFFSMTPVGATNVGSIRIHFDKYLRTNIHKRRDTSNNGKSFSEATYSESSLLLKGHPLSKGEEIGGFNLGSTIVLVFEAPESFEFLVQPGQHVKVGQAFGEVPE